MNPNPQPVPNLPTVLEKVLREIVPTEAPATAHNLFLQLLPLQAPLDTLLGDLCEHIYCELALQFLKTCKERTIDPDSGHFKGWLTLHSPLPGYLLTVFSERFEQDRADAVTPGLPEPTVILLARLEQERQDKIKASAPPVVEAPAAPVDTAIAPPPDAGNELVPPDGSE